MPEYQDNPMPAWWPTRNEARRLARHEELVEQMKAAPNPAPNGVPAWGGGGGNGGGIVAAVAGGNRSSKPKRKGKGGGICR